MTVWNPGQYLQFADERTRPAVDLTSRIQIAAPRRIIDLGCGPGNSTQVLRQRWPDAVVRGLDGSPAMIDAARRAYPEQEWVRGQIEDWTADVPYDVVFSNAAIQWIPDHVRLVARLFRQVAPGGALAIQMPSGAYAPLRLFIREIADDKAWTSRMVAARQALTMEKPHVYYDALAPLATSVDLWETEYQHVMTSSTAIVNWISTTGMRPFLDALNTADERARFVALLEERVSRAYTRRADGRVLFPFKRLFVIAYA